MYTTVDQSKYLSWALRHGLNELGLKPSQEGYVSMEELIRVSDPTYHFTPVSIERIVNSCPKQRFGLKNMDGKTWIRANQGHSQSIGKQIDPEKMMRRLTEPLENVFHGTYKHHLESIQKNGLRRMNRQHIHIAKGLNVKSGKRHDCNLLVYIDMKSAMEDGVSFFESPNGVVLTEGKNGVLEPKYLSFQILY
jgi:2'-phosphotransferase